MSNVTLHRVRAARGKKRYASQDSKANSNAAFQREQTRLHGKLNARTMAPKTPKHMGALADRVYGPTYRCKRGVHHFST